MAITRSRRRRNGWIIAFAGATVVVVSFAHEVSTVAHHTPGVRASENGSFVALANGLVNSENNLDTRLASLAQGTGVSSRMSLLIALRVANAELDSLDSEASLLVGPTIHGGLDRQLSTLLLQRNAAYRQLLAYIAGTLQLPWASPPPTRPGTAQGVLLASDATWGSERHTLEGRPGGTTLNPFSSTLASLALSQDLSSLGSRPTFALARNFSIAALEIQPAPLQAPRGTLSMPPVSTMSVTAALDNLAVDTQSVVVTFTVVSSKGGSSTVTRSAQIGPLNSVGLSTVNLTLTPGETGRLTVSATGDGVTRVRTYALVVAPPVPTG